MSTRSKTSVVAQQPTPIQAQIPLTLQNPKSQSTPGNVTASNSAVKSNTPNGATSMGNLPHKGSVTASFAASPRRIPQKEADKQPWRYRGYPAMCTWVASDDDFFVLRRFEKSGARVALRMQDRIAELEEELAIEDMKGRYEVEDCGTFRGETRERRRQILDEMTCRLERYQRFILDHSALKARPDANTFQIGNVKTWLKNNNYPIAEDEVKYIDKEGDLMPVVPKIKTPLRRFMDRYQVLRRISCFRERKLNSSHYGFDDPENFASDTTTYSNDSVMDKFVTCITIALGLAMLIGPLWLLQHFSTGQSNLSLRLTIITVFLIAFTLLLSIVTVARPFETLAATAAYGAVLMVFMQLNSGISN